MGSLRYLLVRAHAILQHLKMSAILDKVTSNLNADMLHTLVQGCAWILMQTGAKLNADDSFYFLITFALSVLHWNATYGSAFEKNEQFGYLATGLSFTAALLWTLNFVSTANNVACLVMLWTSFGLYAYGIVKNFVE